MARCASSSTSSSSSPLISLSEAGTSSASGTGWSKRRALLPWMQRLGAGNDSLPSDSKRNCQILGLQSAAAYLCGIPINRPRRAYPDYIV